MEIFSCMERLKKYPDIRERREEQAEGAKISICGGFLGSETRHGRNGPVGWCPDNRVEDKGESE